MCPRARVHLPNSASRHPLFSFNRRRTYTSWVQVGVGVPEHPPIGAMPAVLVSWPSRVREKGNREK